MSRCFEKRRLYVDYCIIHRRWSSLINPRNSKAQKPNGHKPSNWMVISDSVSLLCSCPIVMMKMIILSFTLTHKKEHIRFQKFSKPKRYPEYNSSKNGFHIPTVSLCVCELWFLASFKMHFRINAALVNPKCFLIPTTS